MGVGMSRLIHCTVRIPRAPQWESEEGLPTVGGAQHQTRARAGAQVLLVDEPRALLDLRGH